jgi:hypothetical protein
LVVPVGSSQKFELPPIADVLFRVFLKLNDQEVVILPLAAAMVDDDVG